MMSSIAKYIEITKRKRSNDSFAREMIELYQNSGLARKEAIEAFKEGIMRVKARKHFEEGSYTDLSTYVNPLNYRYQSYFNTRQMRAYEEMESRNLYRRLLNERSSLPIFFELEGEKDE